MSLKSLCNQSCDIRRKTTAAASPTNLGGHVLTWDIAYTSLPVSGPQQPTGGTRMEAMKRQMEVTHTFYTYHRIELVTGDRILFNGAYYHCQWFEDMGGKGRAYAIHCLKV